MKLLIISCSLSQTSHSADMANRLGEASRALGNTVELIDLRQLPLPFCDAGDAYSDANVQMISAKIAGADTIALAVPIYNYDVGGAARNLIALTGSVWQDKTVGLIGAAGGERSYMSLIPLANSLMLDFRCIIVPRFVYASKKSFDNHKLSDPNIEERLVALASALNRIGNALQTDE